MQVFSQTLHDLKNGMTKFPQTMINVRLSNSKGVMENKTIQLAVSEAEQELGNTGRVLLRPSGTEPVVRVMVEGEDVTQVDKLAAQIAEVVAQEMQKDVA
jgi:phosphoglucosamine mutase